MKINFKNDGKEKSQSWEATGEVLSMDDLYRSNNGFASVEITAYGSTKEEAYSNFIQSVQKIANDMHLLIEGFATNQETGNDL